MVVQSVENSKSYNDAAVEYFGKFAFINTIEEE
jgi:hypothetical protein